jgi:hypothetical protein
MVTTRALPWAGVRAGCLAGHHRANRMRRLSDHRREDAGVKAADKTANGSGAERTAQAGGSRQPDSGPSQQSGTRRADVKAGGRAAEWSEWSKKYGGSVAEDLWRRLDAMEVIN